MCCMMKPCEEALFDILSFYEVIMYRSLSHTHNYVVLHTQVSVMAW